MTYTETINHKFINPATGDAEEFELKIRINHDPGVWTYSNGDPGYPESTDYDIMEHNCPSWVTDDMLEEFLDNLDIDHYSNGHYAEYNDEYIGEDYPIPDDLITPVSDKRTLLDKVLGINYCIKPNDYFFPTNKFCKFLCDMAVKQHTFIRIDNETKSLYKLKK